MLDLSLSEILLILVACVIFFKPEDLPVIMRAIGKFFGKIKNYTNEILEALEEPRTKKIKGDDGEYYDAYDVDKIFPLNKKDDGTNHK